MELHKLNRNDTDSLVEDDKFEDTDSLYGVEKPDWEEFISSEKGKAYLTAWRSVVESAGVVINEEMSYVDAGYADPISDRFYEERKAIEKALHGELAPSEEAKPFIKPLLECYHKRFPLDLLYEHYGWDNESVYTALAENISDPKLNEYAVDTVNDINFDEFMDEKLEEIHWLSSSDICFTEYSDVTVRRLVEYIRVMKDNSIIIVLKGGIQIREPIETNN